MKKQVKRKNKNNKNSFSLVQVFLVLAFVAGMTFLCLSLLLPSNKTEDKPVNTVVNTTEQKKEAKKTEDKKNEGEGENPDKTPKQNEDTPETNSKEINLSLTKNEVVNDKYMVRVNIYEEVADGICDLEMKSTKGDYVKRSAKVIEAGADYASCEGFDIQTSGIASGSYTFTIKVTIGERSKSLSGTINI